jgi:hypothetical protein
MKECLNCKLEFEPNRWWQDFCKTKCRMEFHRARYRAQRIEFGEAVSDVMRDKITDEQKQEIVGPLSLIELVKQEQREHRIRIKRRLATADQLNEEQRQAMARIRRHQATVAAEREKASEVLARIRQTERKMVRRI